MINNLFKNKIVLVTGGTGSFGSTFIKKIIKQNLKKLEFSVEMKKNKKI